MHPYSHIVARLWNSLSADSYNQTPWRMAFWFECTMHSHPSIWLAFHVSWNEIILSRAYNVARYTCWCQCNGMAEPIEAPTNQMWIIKITTTTKTESIYWLDIVCLCRARIQRQLFSECSSVHWTKLIVAELAASQPHANRTRMTDANPLANNFSRILLEYCILGARERATAKMPATKLNFCW